MKEKNTRLVYTDDKNLKIYQSLPDKDFKEFFMTYLTYEIGDDVSKTISNPYLQTMFMATYADKINYNEEKWERKAKANRENGKKGGRKPKNNTDLQPNTEFDTEAKISPNEPHLATNGTDVPQEAESLPEAKIEAKEEEIIIDTDNTEDMGTLIGTLSNFAIIETRDANSQKPMEELQRQTIERENGKEEYAANFNKAYNIQTASVSEPTKRIEIEKDRSMEYMEKCLSIFDLNKAKRQISRAKSVDENMKRVADCLDPLLEGFSKTERSKFYISIIEDVLNSK